MIRIPASSASRGPENRTGRPLKRISPSYSVIAPARIFMSVLLPAPFSPQRATTSPARAKTTRPASARTPAKALGDVPHLEPGRHGGGRAGVRTSRDPGSSAGRSQRGMA